MPIRSAVPGPLRSRPRLVTLGVDSSSVLGGFTRAHPTQQDLGTADFGSLDWTVWNARQGWATGAEWSKGCFPSCAQATYVPHKLKIHVYDPNSHGIFQQMKVISTRSVGFHAMRLAGVGDLPSGWAWG